MASLSDLDETEIDDELQLPATINIDLDEKKELLLYKRHHSQVDWEIKILSLIESQQQQADYLRLQAETSRLKRQLVVNRSASKAPKRTVSSLIIAHLNFDILINTQCYEYEGGSEAICN